MAEAFARAVAAKDHDRVRELLHPEVDFRGMTPGRTWKATGPEEIIHVLGLWFDDSDTIEELLALELDAFADRARIGWLRIMCSGFRPVT